MIGGVVGGGVVVVDVIVVDVIVACVVVGGWGEYVVMVVVNRVRVRNVGGGGGVGAVVNQTKKVMIC